MPGLSMYARLRIAIFLGSVHEHALTRFTVCLRRQFVHYVINSQPPRFRALLSAYADGLFVNGLEKNKCRFCGACFFGTHYIINTFILKCYWIFCQM